MKYLILLALIIGCKIGFSQEDSNVPRNELALEQGYFHRGLATLSYTRNFAKQEKSYFGVSGAAGIGVQFIDDDFLFDAFPIYFLTLAPSYQYGIGNNFLSLGLEVKNVISEDAYNGTGVGAFAGFHYNGPRGFLFRFRLGFSAWSDGRTGVDYYEFSGQKTLIPMGGFAFGFSFGDPL
ncbi:MAG: hypothetical protein Crog4KO_28280 [Crocinitomicaceae bacterium]